MYCTGTLRWKRGSALSNLYSGDSTYEFFSESVLSSERESKSVLTDETVEKQNEEVAVTGVGVHSIDGSDHMDRKVVPEATTEMEDEVTNSILVLMALEICSQVTLTNL